MFVFQPALLRKEKVRDNLYNRVKTLLQTKHHLVSQFLLHESVENPDTKEAVLQGVILQIVGKMRGNPWRISNPVSPAANVMIVGIDCTHDTINMKKSVIAYVSSVDSDFSNYFT